MLSLGRSAFTFHVCRFDLISISVVAGQQKPNDYIYYYGIFWVQNRKFVLWIIANPRSLTLLVGQHAFNLYIASNLAMPVAWNFICCGLMPM